MRQLFLIAAIWGVLAASARAQEHALPQDGQPSRLTLEEAVQLLHANNNAIKISQSAIEVARAEKQQLNAAWYPQIGATGGYFHFSNNITADANIGELAQGAIQELQNTIPGLEQIISQLLPQLQQVISGLGNITLSVPLLNRDITTFDVAAIWPLLTGGKRIYAGRIGNSIQETAENLATLTINAQTALMLNTWYTLKLGNSVVEMQQENLQYMEKLLSSANRLMEEGFINKAGHLVVQVAREEAGRELENALRNVQAARKALNTIIGTDLGEIYPQGNFFTLDSLPDMSEIETNVLNRNSQLKILRSQQDILENKEKIAKSNYLPNIALFARQNIWSRNIPKNLMPRTTIGAAMQWNIFDGLAREKEIKKSRLQQQQTGYALEQARNELLTAAFTLRNRMEDAAANINTLQHTLQLAKELLREREKSFAEGMCTSTEVVEARTAVTKARTALHLAGWEYCTSLANLLALSSDTDKFITLQISDNAKLKYNE